MANTNTLLDFPTMDAQAQENLSYKLWKIPPRLLTRPLTVQDIYTKDMAALNIPHIPTHLQLDFFFRHYNAIACGNFQPHASKPFDVNRAIWYFEVSPLHSLSNDYSDVRYNVIPMAFVLVAKMLNKDTRAFCDPSTESFTTAYMHAWLAETCGLENHSFQEDLVRSWESSGFDLVHFPEKAKRTMMVAVWNLLQMVSEMTTMEPEHFLTAVREGKVRGDVFEREGPILVLHWVFAHMKKEKERKEMEIYEGTGEPGAYENLFVVDTAPIRVDESPLSDLLVDVEPGVEDMSLPDEGRRPWITVENALSIVQDVKKDFLTGLMGNVSLG